MIRTINDIKRLAVEVLTTNALNYYESGGDDEQTLSENCRAYDRLHIRPSAGIKNLSTEIDVSTDVFGYRFGIPIGISPLAMQRMAHDEGEVASAKAAAHFQAINLISTLTTVSYEEVTQAVPDCPYWAQLYIYRDKGLSKELVEKSVNSGFKAIVITINTPCSGRRIADVKGQFQLPSNMGLENFAHVKELKTVTSSSGSALVSYVNKNIKRKTWEDIKWLREITTLPILLKGIITREEAEECLRHDIQGIIVSNHGGRQLDGVPATIEALPEVVRAVQGKIPVFVDGGIRRGSDVFKALALGAKAVFVGRPVLYGLAYNGTEGVKKVFEILEAELKQAMCFTGCKRLSDIDASMVVHENSLAIFSSNKIYPRNWKITPDKPLCIEDVRENARNKKIQINDVEELKNSEAFYRLRFRPQRLRGVKETDTSLEIFGLKVDIPVFLDFPNTKLGAAAQNGCRTFGAGMVTSDPSSSKDCLYQLPDASMAKQEETVKQLKSAEKSLCKAIVLNVNCIGSSSDLEWIVSQSAIPVLVRGVMSIRTALDCVKCGVKGIIVSNEDDFEFTSTPIDILPSISNAVNYKVPLFLGGGIRKGTDILKALAFGASAVFIRKPLEWGHVYQEENGIKKVLEILSDEMHRAMLFLGANSLREVSPSMVVHESYYWNIQRP